MQKNSVKKIYYKKFRKKNLLQKNIPVFNLNVPGGGLQQPAHISPDTKIYSSYTSELVAIGNIPKGTICDAPIGNKNYGKPFHVIEYNPANHTYMTHGVKFN